MKKVRPNDRKSKFLNPVKTDRRSRIIKKQERKKKFKAQGK
jgi:hypothetical protein